MYGVVGDLDVHVESDLVVGVDFLLLGGLVEVDDGHQGAISPDPEPALELSDGQEDRTGLEDEPGRLHLDIDIGQKAAVGVGGDGDQPRVGAGSYHHLLVMVERYVVAVRHEGQPRGRVALDRRGCQHCQPVGRGHRHYHRAHLGSAGLHGGRQVGELDLENCVCAYQGGQSHLDFPVQDHRVGGDGGAAEQNDRVKANVVEVVKFHRQVDEDVRARGDVNAADHLELGVEGGEGVEGP